MQPVLHRYNDAKYIWSDACARVWLQGFVRAHNAALDDSAVDGAIDVIDLEAFEEGSDATRPILLD